MDPIFASAQEVREWLIAFGTVGALIVAIFGTTIWERIRRPKLSLHFDVTKTADAHTGGIRIPTARNGGTRAAFARLEVRNADGKRTAESVEVLIESLRLRPPAAGSDIPRDSESIADLSLPVSNSDPRRTQLNLPPGMGRHFDFVHIRKNQVVGPGGQNIVRVDVHPQPDDLRQQVYGGEFEIDLIVAAANASPKRYTANLKFDGTWPDDEDDFWSHFSMGLAGR